MIVTEIKILDLAEYVNLFSSDCYKINSISYERKNMLDDPGVPAREVKSKRGRPQCFDEQEVLHKAMLLFWQYGYEATSMSDLTKALNLTAPSLYRCFGDKQQLFQRCLEYYLANEACVVDRIFSDAKTAKVAIELFLYENVKRLVQENKPTGCMLLVSTMNCSEQHADLQEEIKKKRISVKEKIYQRVLQGQQAGEISSLTSVQEITDFYTTVLQGMTFQARDGVGREQLNQVAAYAMKSWELF